jgi:deoxyribodipyrimidine photo-lyase
MNIATERIRFLNNCPDVAGPVIYWMSRDQRVQDNWALLYAQYLAETYKQPLLVLFNIVPQFAQATWRQYSFMLKGLEEVANELHQLNIPFYLLFGAPQETIPQFIKTHKIGTLVSDFSPLRIYSEWKKAISACISIPFYEVDTHNIVPCWYASSKQEFGAYTIRPKINRYLKEFLTDIPSIHFHELNSPYNQANLEWHAVKDKLEIDFSVLPIQWCLPGSKAAQATMQAFIQNHLHQYATDRNNPTINGQSNLSPYLHFGQISAQRIAWEVQNSTASPEAKAAFLEELIIRRELADNYCFYNKHYDTFAGFPEWAQQTLLEHSKDQRVYLYNQKQLELAKTHDQLWNAAQLQMVRTGKMHGYMRMYWAKKILEWTESPQQAQEIAIYLNDKYELDGRDPNGYVGIAWSIGGLHDRAWFQHPIFGKVRYMNANGCARKFNVAKYIDQYS